MVMNVNPKTAKSALKTLLSAPVYTPVMLSSSPGVGKSSIASQVADELKHNFLDIRVAQYDAVDFRGLPVPQDGKTTWFTPDLFPSEGDWVVLLDELPDAPLLVQSALYQLVLDGRLGDYVVPKGVKFLAAGNLQTDRAAAGRLSTALASRFIHLSLEPELDSWCEWAIDAGIRTEVIAFLRFKRELLHDFDPARNTERSFPCPRTWEFVSRILDAKPGPDVEYPLYCGAVGEGAGAEFAAFAKIFRSLPNIDNILMNPDTAMVPEKNDVRYAVATSLAMAVSEQTASNFFKYCARLPKEFAVMSIRDALHRDENLANNRDCIDWVSRNSDVLAGG